MPDKADSCFASERPFLHAAAYSEGRWVPSEAAHPYRISPKFWSAIGSKMHGELPQHYGHCDDPASKRAPPPSPPRKLFDWVPSTCSLQPLDASGACGVLGGKQIVVVGDSTVFQFFLSFVLMLGGRFGRDVKHGFVVADLTASACGGTTRINFIRSDLLLWTQSIADYHAVQRCDGFTILHPFVQRASRDADIVLLGVGHHFPRSLMLAEKYSRWDGSLVAKKARVGFFARNLNHTLTSLLARRAAWGHADPATVVVLGTSTPVRGCAQYTAPLPLGEAVSAIAAAPSAQPVVDGARAQAAVSTVELRWAQYPRYNELARWMATAQGASFLDVAAPSAMRPDGAMGRFWPAGDRRQLDCVHYCLPGVVDTWSTLLYNLLGSPRLQRALRATASASAADSDAGAHRRAARTSRRRFLDANATLWHTERGYAERFEACKGGGARGGGACEPSLQLQPWWPFYCWEGRDRPAKLGADFNQKYQPWQPAEMFV